MGIATRKPPESLGQKKFWLNDRDRKRIIRHVRTEFPKAIQSKWHTHPDRDFLKGVLTKGLSPDPEKELEVLRGSPVKVVLHDKHVLLPPNKPGERIIEKSSVQFSLDPHFSYQRTEEIDGKRKSEFDLIRIEIQAPEDRKTAGRFIEKAEKDLASLGFDKRFRESYLKNAELQFEKYLRPMATRLAGEVLDEFRRILGEIRGDHLWSILVTNPETKKEDVAVRLELEEKIASCKTTRKSLAISHNAKSLIIAEYLDVNDDEEKKISERIRSRRRRKN